MSTPNTINNRLLEPTDNTYIIAEIGSNFDGSKERAKRLIELAAECGADAAKFQAFRADSIVSAYGFDGLNAGFQADWDRPVYEVYKDAELSRRWIGDLVAHADSHGIDFLCTPYDYEAVDLLADHDMPAFKIGSGDITWHRLLEHVAQQGKPVILATGASTLGEVEAAVETIQTAGNDDIVLLQCVTNYPSDFESANIRAMSTLAETFNVPVGYSDHTPGSTVPLGAVSRGANVIEKHFTDDKSREGPDHSFAMNVEEFERMVQEVRNLNTALGSPRKRIYDEEMEPRILQRRALRAATDLDAGTTITDDDVVALRPCPEGVFEPANRETLLGRTVNDDMVRGECFSWDLV